jgi:hypothetical protein
MTGRNPFAEGTEMPDKEEEQGSTAVQRRAAPTAAIAAAEQAKALIQAKFVMAWRNPRKEDDCRQRLLKACQRPKFAEHARYAKPCGGGNTAFGPSIRFADESAKVFGNIDTQKFILHEDDNERVIQLMVTDLETNLSKSETLCVAKTIERRVLKEGQIAISSRINSYGKKVHLIQATDDEVFMKENQMCAKVRRNLELQLIPQDLIDEGMDQCVATMRQKDAEDPDAAKKRVLDSFGRIGVFPSDIESYLGHPTDRLSPKDLEQLRTMYKTISDGEANWQEYVDQKAEEDQAAANGEKTEKDKGDKKKPPKVPKAEPPKDAGGMKPASDGLTRPAPQASDDDDLPL